MKKRSSRQEGKQDPPVRPQLYVSVLVVMLMLVLAYTGQWDWVFAAFIGLLLGNGFSALRKR